MLHLIASSSVKRDERHLEVGELCIKCLLDRSPKD